MPTLQSIARNLRAIDVDTLERLAASIPSRTDLGDEGAVIKALADAGWTCNEFFPWLDEIIERARAIRFEERFLAPPALALAMLSLVAFFSPLPDGWRAHAAVLSPEGVTAWAENWISLQTALTVAGVVLALIVGVTLIILGLERVRIGPFVPLGDGWSPPYGSEPQPEPTREQRYRDAEGLIGPLF